MAVYGGPDIVTDGLVLHLDAANDKSYDPVVEDCSLVLNMEGSNGSTTFTDGSKYGHTVTANGNAQISTGNSRFGASSAYFDGNGDYVTLSHSFLSDSLSGYDQDFTLECWFYTSNLSSARTIISSREDPIPQLYGFTLRHQTDGRISLFGYTGSGSTVAMGVSAYSVSIGEWHHTAVTYSSSSNNWKLFIDGVLAGESTGVVGLDGSSPILRIGIENNGNYYLGYIDSLRIVKGKALYTENFTPPKKSFPEYKWGDLSGNENNGTFVNGVSYGSSNYGVMSFDGSNDYIGLPYSQLLNMGTEFTICGFIKINDLASNQFLFSTINVTTTNTYTEGYWFGYRASASYGLDANTIAFQMGKNAWGWQVFGSNDLNINDNQHHFIAVTASNLNTSSSIIKFYIDDQSINASYWTGSPKAAVRYSSNVNSIRMASYYPATRPSYGEYYSSQDINTLLIYDYELSANEVRQNFEATKGRYGL